MIEVKLPVGRSGFADIRNNNYYYVDKSGLIEELLKTDATQVTLITRPRRFGKTLGMSMLSEFFDIQKDSHTLFEGLIISKNKNLCKEWMNQYPTLFLTFKSVDGLNFKEAYGMLQTVIAEIYKKHLYLINSERISSYDKDIYDKISSKETGKDDIKNSLLKLTELMVSYYNKSVILLIDEFDTISYHDYNESFYHAFIVGLVSNAGYKVESNYEMGLGRSDIVVKDRHNRRALVIEIKWTNSENALEKECDDALRQMKDKQYAKKVERTGYRKIVCLGIAFCRKQCLVKK